MGPLAALFVLALGVSGPGEGCRKCDDEGVVACKRCAKDACESERGFVFCSVVASCEDCGGAGVGECAKCETEPTRDLEAERAAASEWLGGVRAVDAFMERELNHARSEHFTITWDIKRIDLGRAGKPHPAMHVYLDRLEELMAAFQGHLGATSEDFSAPTHVMLWSSAKEQEKASLEYTLQRSSTESKLMGKEPVVSIHYDKGHLHEEFELHQAMVHQTAHCLLSNVFDGIWPGNIKGGWIDEGLAHWYETDLFGGVRHYCYVESDTIQYFKFGRWESSVRIAVDRDETPGFLSVAGRNTVEMTPEQRMFAWSYCDYVIRGTPGKLGAVSRAVKQRKPVKDVLAGALDVTPFEFERQWKDWVKATYSPKKKRR